MLRFAKYHGIGNDFVVVNGLGGAPVLRPEQARAICDRHFGVGCDQLLTLRPVVGADAGMQVQNSDGSEAGQCGNGLRCVARFLYDEGIVPESRDEVVIVTGGVRYPVRRLSKSRYLARMGKPAFAHPELPHPARPHGAAELAALDRRFDATCVHIGNPHAVIFEDEGPRRLAETYGPPLERHPSFVARANVSFVRLVEGGFEAVVYERGDGITLACGSGACAIGAAAVERGLWQQGTPMKVKLPGGTLTITLDEAGEILMEGDAMRVFVGEVPLP